MASLLSAVTVNGAGSGVATSATDAWIEIPNTSVFDGAEVHIQASSANTSNLYTPTARPAIFKQPGWVQLQLPSGTFVRAVVAKAGAATNLTCNLL